MACSRNLSALILCAALSAGTVVAQTGKEKSAGAEKKKTVKKAEATPAAEKAKAPPKPKPKLSVPLIQGHDSTGVVIPFTDESGKKTMNFRIGVGTRLDENTVKMTDLLIEMYDEAGTREMSVAMPVAQLDLTSRVIRGDQRVTIKRSDFEITGQAMEFNTDARQGWIKGDVKMIIYDLDTETVGDDAAPTP